MVLRNRTPILPKNKIYIPKAIMKAYKLVMVQLPESSRLGISSFRVVQGNDIPIMIGTYNAIVTILIGNLRRL